MKYKINIAFLFILTLIISTSCHRTNKNVLSEAYHDLTAHYNSEWNSNDKLRTVLNNVNKNPSDIYDSILNINAFENLQATRTYTGDYELIIKKSTFSIQQHESSKWTDNNFYLMGMAHFMKGDYPKAIEHFQYITAELKEGYKDEFINKKQLKKKNKKIREKKAKIKAKIKKQKKKGKKVDEDVLRPHEKGLAPHPSRNPALIMLVLAYTKNHEYSKANSVISYVEADPKFPDNYIADFNLAKATFFIEQNKYEYAIAPLKLALNELHKKKDKARPSFVLAQLYQSINQSEEAIKEFENVLGFHPDYNMEFNAKLNIAIISANGNGNSKKAKDILSKMSRDGKNTDMLDQIFYHLGKIAYKENNKEEAIIDYKKSLAKNKTNSSQKALSYIALADVYYDDEEYKIAKMYYDSSLTVLTKTAANYAFIKDRDERLSRLVTQLDIINTEDSLQVLADLSEADRKKKLKEIINSLLKEREKNEKTKLEGTNTVNKTDVTDNTNSSFYFYNAAARNRGYNTFKKLWGDVKLTDNWRRQDKSNVINSNDLATDDNGDNSSNSSDFRDELKKLQDMIPLTSEQRKMSDDKRLDAYFLLANIYKDDFNQNQKAIETFEVLLSKFPNNKYEAECYYNLYLLYAQVNTTKAAQYKELVLSKFPTSILAEALKDPDFLKKQKSKDQEIDEAYEQAYNLYTNGNYDLSLTKCKEGVNKYKGNKLEPKFAYLAVLNTGKQKKYEEFSLGLSNIIKTYPSDPVKDEAEKMLLYMSNLSEYLKQDSIINFNNAQFKINNVAIKSDIKTSDTTSTVINEAKKDDKKKDKKDVKDGKTKNNVKDSITSTVDTVKPAKIDSTIAIKPADDMPAGMDLSKFTKEENGIHRILIYPSNVELGGTDLINRIKAFDNLKPIYKKLMIGNLLLNATTKLVTIKEFTNEADAVTYYNELIKSDAFKGLNMSDYKIMVCTSKNQSIAVGNSLLDNLYWFFRKNYLK